MANRLPKIKGLKKPPIGGYMKAKIRQGKKALKPPTLAGRGVRGYR